jgi:hypothetical protein
MHIILGLLGTIVTILVLIHRLAQIGIDIRGLNPFLWHRRRKWKDQIQGNPVFRVDSPMDSTAILAVAVAKADGDLTREAKEYILDQFESEFKLSKKDAGGLLVSSGYLLGDGSEVRNNIKKFLAPSKPKFSDAQISSAINLVQNVANSQGSVHPNAVELLSAIRSELCVSSKKSGTWQEV